MKAWMKLLMWLGLGGGIGFFAGYQVGRRSATGTDTESYNNGYYDGYADNEKDYNKGYHDGYSDRKEDEAIAGNSLRDYRGGDFDGDEINIVQFPVVEEDVPEMIEEIPVIDDPNDEVEEIRELHPQDILPVIITEDEFIENKWGYDREYMKYFTLDDVLYNETVRNIIKDPDEVVGVGTLCGFYPSTKYPSGRNEIYVLNDTLGVIFRIVRIDSTHDSPLDGVTAPDYEEEDDTE